MNTFSFMKTSFAKSQLGGRQVSSVGTVLRSVLGVGGGAGQFCHPLFPPF
jgi:hypothetical protein